MNRKTSGLRPALLVAAGIVLGVLMTVSWSAYSSNAQTASGCRTFTQTGHKVCGRFLEYWDSHGGLAQQGYPLSEEFTETSDLNGRPYTVQYFERAVFEYHPENRPPNDVLLSQLGTYLGSEKYTQGFPATSGQAPFYEDRTDPAAALVSYYNAVNRREYERAYSYFEGAPNPQPALAPPLAQFVQGYADTASVALAVGKFTTDAGAGNIFAAVPVAITATHTNGGKETFSGCYVLHRVNDGISSDPNDVLWSIRSAKIAPAAANATLDELLAQTCAP
jgi:hypothetical protein